MEVWDLFVIKRDENNSVVVEDIGKYLVERLGKVFVDLLGLPKLKHAVFDAYMVLGIHCFEPESMYIVKMVEIYWLEFILENPHNFLLEKSCKLEENAHDFGAALTGDFIFFIY